MTNPSKLEQVARAITVARGGDPNQRAAGKPEAMWERFLPEARAAIAAMELPTEEMVEAAVQAGEQGWDEHMFSAHRYILSADVVPAILKAAVRAALKEEKP